MGCVWERGAGVWVKALDWGVGQVVGKQERSEETAFLVRGWGAR